MLIGFGGALGSILRTGISSVLPQLFTNIPLGTLFVNVFGGLLIGIASAFHFNCDVKTINDIKFFCIPGFLGGFTTFSAFTLEVTRLIEKEKFRYAIGYILLSVLLSVMFFYVGAKLTKLMQK
ncbi:MAG: fluoride efflux transporter CrcB [Holosporaceae bacterium]|jgi:CrcB protein|nr:fluoride efflux transporter CrcB [Holosporaceae bacterium]